MRPHNNNLALHLIQLWQGESSRGRRDSCLLPWFCTIILFPLLVCIYWGFIKTEWVSSQPSSINHPPPPRWTRFNSLLSLAFPCLHFSPSPSLSFPLVAFCLIFFSLSPLCYHLLLSGEKVESCRSLISNWGLLVWGTIHVTLSFILCWGI